MAKSAQELEQEFLANIVEQTGHDLNTWIDRLADSGETKTNALINHIKKSYGLNHLQANLLTGIYLNGGKPVYDYEVMFNSLFEGKENQLPLYREIESLVKANIPDANVYPTKTYVSLDAERCFGTVKINKNNIRVGLDLGERPFDDYVQPAKSLGAMPRISHMIELHSPEDVNDDLLHNLQQAYHHVHS